ncbi:MAG: M1 family metallopeptidase [Chloroflexi bacterium]|nr:M1 family metallopeptidase [Chloroflexota bacterium]
MPTRNTLLVVLFLLLTVVIPGSQMTPVFASAPVPNTVVRLYDAGGSQSPGVYLGYGIILTSWQNVSGERYLWNATRHYVPPLRDQLPFYIADNKLRPEELAISQWLCREADSYVVMATPSAPECFAYNLTVGMQVGFNGSDARVPVEHIHYEDRDTDIALLEIDSENIEENFPALEMSRLSAVPLQSGEIIHSGESGRQEMISVLDDLPQLTVQPAHSISDGGSQKSHVIAVEPIGGWSAGMPYFDAQGALVGLFWAESAAGDRQYLTPAGRWYHDLWQLNTVLDSDALAQILQQADVPHAIAGQPSTGDPFSPELGNTGYDALHYDLDLTLDPATRALSGVAIIRLQATYHHLATFSLDLRQMTVDDVQVDGQPVEFQQLERKLVVNLAEPVAFGTVLEVSVAYHGIASPAETPYSRFFTVGLEYTEDPPRMAFINQPDGASTWFPCNDFPSDRASYNFALTVPDGTIGVANGIPMPSTAPNTYHWEMSAPLATNLVVVAVGDYTELVSIASGITVRNYAYEGTEDKVAAVLSSTGLSFEILEGMFGPYPFETYGHVVTPLPNGALETQTMTAMPQSVINAEDESILFTLVVHELAHHWYGNTVALASWQHMWLNEGFATYAEWLALGARYDEDHAHRQRELAEQRIIAANRQTPLAYPEPREMYGADTYVKGAWVLHMLRLQLGDPLFFELIQRWVVAYADYPVDTWDFFRFAEQVSGQDLTQFRRTWLETGGIPHYRLVWTQTKQGTEIRACNLRETPYSLRVPVILRGDGNDYPASVSLTTTESQLFAPEFPVVEVIVDPDQELLGNFEVQFTETTPSCLLAVR